MVSTDLDVLQNVLNTTNTIGITINSDVHVNNLMDAANTIVNGEFTIFMSEKAVTEPKRFAHMYEWNQIGDPNARLWKYILSGRGKNRETSYNFVASKTAVPVADKLKQVGVKNNHIFYWKSMVMELGLPVNISPVIAQALVFEGDGSRGKGTGTGTSNAWFKNGVVLYKGTISIGRAGNGETWGAFAEAYAEWFASDAPKQKLEETIGQMSAQTIKDTYISRIKQFFTGKNKSKSISITPMGLDTSYEATLQASLNKNYAAAAATRRMLADE